MRTFFWYFFIMKTCISFSPQDFFKVFEYLSLYKGSLSNPFFITLLTNNSLSFVKEDIYLVSSKSLLYALFWKHTQGHKIFKITFFTKKNFVIYYYSINDYIIYWNWAFVLSFSFSSSISPSIIILLPILNMVINFYLSFFYFYDTPFLSVKSAFCNTFTRSI